MITQAPISLSRDRVIGQIGIVVTNLDDAIAAWERIYRIGPWHRHVCNSSNLQITVRKEETIRRDFSYRLATTMIGDLQIELIEANETVPLYHDFLIKTGGGLHHIREKMAKTSIAEELAYYQGLGMEVTFGGTYNHVVFYYIDTTPHLGVQLEISNY